MEDLKDCTFIIPVRLETKERARNLILVLRYISHYFDTNIIICECDSEQRVPQILQVLNLSESVHYLFEEIKANIFHRTRLLNWMTWEARTPLVVNYDVDVLFKPKQYVEAADTIRRGECEFCYPYEGEFYDVPEKTVDEI